jgi:hypothetical protein
MIVNTRMAWYDDHLSSVNESYFEHMGFAWSMACRCLKCSLALFIHGLFPWWFTDYGSRIIKEAHTIVQEKFGDDQDHT